MVKRYIQADPDAVRRVEYDKLDGDALSAIWEAISVISASGVDIGPKATDMMSVRQAIKEAAPKP